MIDYVELASDELRIRVDPGRGAEIASIRHLVTGAELLMRTPWAAHADTIRPGRLTFPAEASADAWTEAYSGGWQIVFPHAGAPEEVDGVVQAYHGEASTVAWVIDDTSSTRAALHLELVTVPARIDRVIEVSEGRVTVVDRIQNVSAQPFSYDYMHHPAFGDEFLSAGGKLFTSATSFVSDPTAPLPEFVPGSVHPWPMATSATGEAVDLSVIPAPDQHTLRFGYLDEFGDSPSCRIESTAHRLGATLAWPAESGLHQAWFWQQVASHPGYPWYGRGYAIALEPSTTPTSGAQRVRSRLRGGEVVTYEMSLTVTTLEGGDD